MLLSSVPYLSFLLANNTAPFWQYYACIFCTHYCIFLSVHLFLFHCVFAFIIVIFYFMFFLQHLIACEKVHLCCLIFRPFTQYCGKGLLASSCLSASMEQLHCYWTDFHKILLSIIFRKCAEKIRVSLKSDENKGHFTWRPIFIYDI